MPGGFSTVEAAPAALSAEWADVFPALLRSNNTEEIDNFKG
jgi:hypothetical protein